jgi:hypothetical protein
VFVFVLLSADEIFGTVRVERSVGHNHEYYCYHISVTILLFIVLIKYVICIFPRRVCPLVPRGSFHCFEKENIWVKAGVGM